MIIKWDASSKMFASRVKSDYPVHTLPEFQKIN